MLRRQTIAAPVTIEGVGLHSGRSIRLRMLPAAAHTGVVFVRTDLGGAEIPATLAHVGPSFYATVIGRDDQTVSTIEHLMAALYALLIDDVRIEVDGPEIPILDGSSGPFVERIQAVGHTELDARREYITLIRPVIIALDEKRIAAYPCSEFRVTYAIDFDHELLGYQELSVSLWGKDAFANKVATSRTFTFESDVEKLRENGLALGGSLENAVVLGKDRVLNPPLRFPDEFVRHKILDLTGDLALLGHALRAHVVCYKGGHDLHGRLARLLWSSTASWYMAPWTEDPAGMEAAAEA